ncbi:MAG: hypothetical protein IPK16_28500 [Anaerolineales bacterium]|nr:hypothetical protein [Anaerolineales bacterium]
MDERPQATPVGATLIEQPLYLRETTSGSVFKVSWLPAIVGRTDAALPENNLVVVDLGNLPNGLRVSRRHVRITQEGDQIYVQCMSGNPATLRHVDGTTQSLDKGRGALLPGDVLFLERSEIALRQVVRIDPAPAESDPPTADRVRLANLHLRVRTIAPHERRSRMASDVDASIMKAWNRSAQHFRARRN